MKSCMKSGFDCHRFGCKKREKIHYPLNGKCAINPAILFHSDFFFQSVHSIVHQMHLKRKIERIPNTTLILTNQ